MKRRFLQSLLFLATALAAFAALPRWESKAEAAGAPAPAALRDDAQRGDATSKLPVDLRALVESKKAAGRRQSVIVQFNAKPGARERAVVARHGGIVKHQFASINSLLIELPLARVVPLAAEECVAFVTPDRKISLDMAPTRALLGVDQLRQGAQSVSYPGASYPGADGAGVGIAIIDSGVDYHNRDFQTADQKNSRIVVARDFTVASGDDDDDDDDDGYLKNSHDYYGHGTPVAGVAAGSGWGSRQTSGGAKWYESNYGDFTGVAPNAKIISARVIGNQGQGNISDVIRAIDWVVSIRSSYNVRVMNLSLSAPVLQSYRTDPLCQAAERAVASGITVVASAGNFGHNDVVTGQDAAGKPVYQTIYGGIGSPGNSPEVLTVGATKNPNQSMETWSGTWKSSPTPDVNTTTNPNPLRRTDAQVASYSSRGPTLVDGLVKPDIVAPGTKVIAASPVRHHVTMVDDTIPQAVLPRNTSGATSRMYIQISGTSFAAPAVAGVAALMLQANPSLTPRQVKALLRITAQRLPALAGRPEAERVLTEGAGLVNAYAAVRLARNVRTDANRAAAGQRLLRTGVTLQGLTEDLKLRLTGPGGQPLETAAFTNGIVITDGIVVTDGIVITDGIVVTDGIVITDGIVVTDGIVITDASKVWPNGIVITDSYAQSNGLQQSGGRTYASHAGMTAGVAIPNARFYTDGINAATSRANGGIVFSPAATNAWANSLLSPASMPAGASTEPPDMMSGKDDKPIVNVIKLAPSSPYYPPVPAAAPTVALVGFDSAQVTADEGAGRATVTVTRGGNLALPFTVEFATVDNPSEVRCDDLTTTPGTAYARCDYATSIDTLTFAPGETRKTFTVPLVDDAYVEGPESIQLMLLNAAGADLGELRSININITDNDSGPAPHPADSNAFYVRQHYLDFLSREPEQSGYDAWLGVLNGCPDVAIDPSCGRVAVSSGFFRSHEFQLKGFFVYRFYKSTLGRLPGYEEIIPDMRRVTGQTSAEVFAKKDAFTDAWAKRPDFKTLYPDSLSHAGFVDKLLQTAGVTLSGAVTRDTLVADLQAGRRTRAGVVRAVVEHSAVEAKEYNAAFVAMQYFGYLRRDPDAGGFDGWLNYLNAHPDDFATMVNGFVNSTEYRLRFSQP